METFINFDEIENTDVNNRPFPYFGLEKALNTDFQKDLISDFPEILKGGSFPLESIEVKDSLKGLVSEIKSEQFRALLGKKFDVNLSGKPIVITARGYSREADGKIHTDSKTKLITVLIYLNEQWDSPTGRLRILNSNDMSDCQEEFSSSFGQMIAFKVTENCWHGYLPHKGKRQSLQVNYLIDTKSSKYHFYRHKLSAFFKRYFKG